MPERGVDNVVVGHEDELGLGLELPREKIGADGQARTLLDQILNVRGGIIGGHGLGVVLGGMGDGEEKSSPLFLLSPSFFSRPKMLRRGSSSGKRRMNSKSSKMRKTRRQERRRKKMRKRRRDLCVGTKGAVPGRARSFAGCSLNVASKMANSGVNAHLLTTAKEGCTGPEWRRGREGDERRR